VTAPKLTPRKEPRQPRARATVDAILGAAVQLIRRDGVGAWTTNHVAERAGVSVGSLYQYFPSKESLLTALYLHRRTRLLAGVAAAMRQRDDAGAEATWERAVARAWLGVDDPDVDWAFELDLRDHLVAANAGRRLGLAEDQARQLVGEVLERRGLDAPPRGGGPTLVCAVEPRSRKCAGAAGWRGDVALIDDVAALLRACAAESQQARHQRDNIVAAIRIERR
jgi:AcrR family transcriptional regulator